MKKIHCGCAHPFTTGLQKVNIIPAASRAVKHGILEVVELIKGNQSSWNISYALFLNLTLQQTDNWDNVLADLEKRIWETGAEINIAYIVLIHPSHQIVE